MQRPPACRLRLSALGRKRAVERMAPGSLPRVEPPLRRAGSGSGRTNVPARDHLEDVAREHYAATFAPVRPVQDGAAIEMSSQPHQREARPDRLGVPLPKMHLTVRAHHPLTISRV